MIDTNVFISSFFGGNPKKIVDLWQSGDLIICVSSEIIDEYFEVLERIGLRDQEKKNELLGLFRKGFHLVFSSNLEQFRVVEKDPDDDKFITCAVSLQADIIVSGDHHLLDIRNFMGIKILNPKQFLEFYQNRKG